jgi:uncharacterized membrane protein YdjX (TVP38/TMEM64 family)
MYFVVGQAKSQTDVGNCCLLFRLQKEGEKLLNYMVFLIVTPTLPNNLINFASPIVDVPYHIFLLAIAVGLIPAAYVTVRVHLFLQTSYFLLLVHFLLS